MSNQNAYSSINHIVHISTNISTGCKHCTESISHERFGESINHYIQKHGYRLLHVGQETSYTDNGDLWHSSVAVLGK